LLCGLLFSHGFPRVKDFLGRKLLKVFPTFLESSTEKRIAFVSLDGFDNVGDDFAQSMVVRFVPADNVVEDIEVSASWQRIDPLSSP